MSKMVIVVGDQTRRFAAARTQTMKALWEAAGWEVEVKKVEDMPEGGMVIDTIYYNEAKDMEEQKA